jgi:predicted HAD superfamily hydrolase
MGHAVQKRGVQAAVKPFVLCAGGNPLKKARICVSVCGRYRKAWQAKKYRQCRDMAYMESYQKLQKQILKILGNKRIKVISFDVFDTVLQRKVSSEDTVTIAGKIFSDTILKDTGRHISAKEIVADRQYFQSTQTTPHWAVSEWLNHFSQKFGIDEKIISKGLDCEVEAEVICTHAPKYLINLIKKLRQNGYHVIALSDTWLDKNQLNFLLQKKQFVFDQVFCSCEMKKSKAHGNIFRKIEESTGFRKDNFIHIGDNLESDYIRARLSGWRSIWIPKKHPMIRIWMPKLFQRGIFKIKKSTMICNILEKECINATPLYKMAYENLAPLVILFSFILNKKFQEQNIQTVFFIARDTHLFYKAYKLLAPFFQTDRQIFYLRLSRSAVAACHPNNPLIEIKRVTGKTGNKNINNWLGSFALDDDLRSKILRKAGLDGSESFGTKNKIRLEESCNYYRKDLELFVEKSKLLLADFIRQHFPEDAAPEKIGIVDSGWACTIQESISNVLPDQQISGLYLGVSHESQISNKKSLKYGLIRDDFRHSAFQNPFNASAGVIRAWEILLREDTSTVASLKRTKNGSVIPVKKTDQSIRLIEKEACDKILKGVLSGISDRRGILDLLSYLINVWDIEEFEKIANEFADSIAVYPDSESAKEILKLGFDEGGHSSPKKNLGIRTKELSMIWLPGILARIRFPVNTLSLFFPLLLKMKNIYIKGKIRKK